MLFEGLTEMAQQVLERGLERTLVERRWETAVEYANAR